MFTCLTWNQYVQAYIYTHISRELIELIYFNSIKSYFSAYSCFGRHSVYFKHYFSWFADLNFRENFLKAMLSPAEFESASTFTGETAVWPGVF